jgi:energy-coupling factor transport system permease protein
VDLSPQVARDVEAAPGRGATAGAGVGPGVGPDLPDYVARRPSGFYRSLNPATKLAIAALEVVAAFAISGWLGPALVLVVLAVTAAASRTLRGLLLIGLAALPLAVSIMVVNLFLLPGASDPIARLGPLAPTWSGLRFGLLTTARLLAFSSAIALAYLTTPVDDLLADMSRRGLGRRGVFVVGAAVQMVPRTIERVGEIMDAQRARGMDTEGRIWRRARGLVPLAAPVVFGALAEVEERTMALESRAFTAPGRQTLLRVPPDRAIDSALRWLSLAGVGAIAALRLSGRIG